MLNPLLFGKNNFERIVAIEPNPQHLEVFFEDLDGSITSKFYENKYFILSSQRPNNEWTRLQGNLHYNWGKQFNDYDEFKDERNNLRRYDTFTIYDPKENNMVQSGITYFKGMKLKEVSILAFDIESTGLYHDANSKVLLIANTLRKNGKVIRKMFCYDDYDSPAEMFDAWCAWVREVNPSIMCGHNIYCYDFPYIDYCASMAGASLKLGRDNSSLRFDYRESKFRKDQTQDLHYKKCHIYGREIVDTMFLAIKYDIVTKKYPSYALKSIIATEGLEVKDRQHYDASTIRANYKIPVEWKKIKQYAEHDGDDALTVFDLMAPPFFYITQNIPKSFQQIINSATGSQINSMMIRAYLQEGHSLPKATKAQRYEGAVSHGIPGVHSNVLSFDVASLYPSIMIQYEVYDEDKDPKRYFLELVKTLTSERLANKKRAKEDEYFENMQQAQKIVINSCYGFLGAEGLLFNSPECASFITSTGRQILLGALEWATSQDYETWKGQNVPV